MTIFADKPTIVGDRVTLRPMCAADAEHLWSDLGDGEATRLTGTIDEFTRDQIDTWAATRLDHDDRLDFAVVDRESGDWFGEVVINEWDAENRSCSFRIALTTSARDRGIGTEATRLLVDHVFEHPEVNRLELEVYAFNPRAQAMYEKVGFRCEGVRRQALHWNGEFVDSIVMSILRSDREG